MYWYGVDSDPLLETDASGNLTNEYVFFGGKRIARRDSSSNVNYYFPDHLGTARVLTNASGTVLDDIDFCPYGRECYVASSSSGNTYLFTGKERDSESGLDNFGARYNTSQYGRFMTPDPLGGRLLNPQTLNKYSYVHNNPLNLIDPTGLFSCGANTDRHVCERVDESVRRDLKSNDKNVVRSARAIGPLSKKAGDAGDNGVTVQIGDTQNSGDGVTAHALRQDPNNSNRAQAVETVTLKEGLSGARLDAAVAHEGSHVADAQEFAATINLTTGGLDASKNLSSYQTDLKAYMVTQSVLASGNTKVSYGECGLEPCILGSGIAPADVVTQTINRLLANPANGYHGVTAANPGASLYPDLTTPK